MKNIVALIFALAFAAGAFSQTIEFEGYVWEPFVQVPYNTQIIDDSLVVTVSAAEAYFLESGFRGWETSVNRDGSWEVTADLFLNEELFDGQYGWKTLLGVQAGDDFVGVGANFELTGFDTPTWTASFNDSFIFLSNPASQGTSQVAITGGPDQPFRTYVGGNSETGSLLWSYSPTAGTDLSTVILAVENYNQYLDPNIWSDGPINNPYFVREHSFSNISVSQPSSVPEPGSTAALTCTAALVLAAFVRRRRARSGADA